MLAVADAYGSIISDWPGHKAFSAADAAETLRAISGLQTDPEITALFMQNLPDEADAG